MYTETFTSVMSYLWICKGLHEYAGAVCGCTSVFMVKQGFLTL